MREEKAARAWIEAAVIRIEAKLDALLPHLATKADVARLESVLPYLATTDLADKPSKTFICGILAVLLTAYACGLAGLAILK